MNYIFFLKICLCFLCFNIVNIKAQRPEIVPYINFVKEQQLHPVDYIFQLFEKYDIVILGERDHRDIVQYELIEKIISDKRFTEKVGNIFTEVGMHSRTGWANQILKNEYSSYTGFENELRRLYRDLDYELWEKYNFWAFLSSMYRINTRLLPSQKINLFFTDASFDWDSCRTREEWVSFYQMLEDGYNRDSIMGNNMITEYNRILKDKNTSRKKALVIYNRPHSYQSYIDVVDNERTKHAAAFIFEAYPGKVANVMINYWSFNKIGRERLIAGGKWDAAFLALNNPSVGFDFKDSPFGIENFDQCRPPMENVKYQDVFTGFIFYGGITSWNMVMGIPGVIDDGFGPEFMRREKIIDPDDKYSLEDNKEYYNIVRSYNAFSGEETSAEDIEKYIKYWLE